MLRSPTLRVAIAALALTACALPALARMKSGQIRSTLTSPANVVGTFTNTTSKGTFSLTGTKFALKATKTAAANTDGVHCSSDDIICLVNFHVVLLNGATFGEVGVVLMGEASRGTITAGHDLCKDRDRGTAAAANYFCPEFFGVMAPISLSNVTATCYAPDPVWTAATPAAHSLYLTGHSCEGVIDGSAPPPTSGVLFSSGVNLIVE